MADIALVRIVEDGAHPWARDVNPLFDTLTGNKAAPIKLVGSTADYPLTVQSIASGGPHVAVLHSGTANPKTVAPTAANSVLLVRDDYTAIGMGKEIRLYDSVGTDYAVVTSDSTGALILKGRDANSHTIIQTSAAVPIVQVNQFGLYTLGNATSGITLISVQQSSTPGAPAAGTSRLFPRTDGFWHRQNSDGDEVRLLDADMFTTAGQIPYATGAEAFSMLGIGTARQALLTNSGATAPEWGASLQSLLTTTGDIVYASSANTPARLATGTATQTLHGGTTPRWGGQEAVKTATTNVTTASTTFATMLDAPAGAEMSVTMTTTGGTLLALFTAVATVNTTGGTSAYGFSLDAADTADLIAYTAPTTGYYAPHSYAYLWTGVAAGSHTVRVRWRVNGVATASAFGRALTVIEF